MCEYTVRLNEVLNRMAGRAVEDHFPNHVKALLPLNMVKHGRCPFCGKCLSPKEMRPPGRSTHSLCTQCYNYIIAAVPVILCIICGHPLPTYKKHSQQNQNREIAHYMHEELCRDYFTLIHSTVVGEAFPLQIQELPNSTTDLVLEVEREFANYRKSIQQSLERLAPIIPRFPQPAARLLPSTFNKGNQMITPPGNHQSPATDDLIVIDLPGKATKRRWP